jgi:hypothetical protein
VFKVQFMLSSFKGEEVQQLSEAHLKVLLDALFNINRLWLKKYPKTTRLYSSGVVYRPEPVGRENWQDIPSVIRQGYGDCEDLACWRAAELVETEGVAARPIYRWRRERGIAIYHIIVRLPDGSIDDPSRRLGIGTTRAATLQLPGR